MNIYQIKFPVYQIGLGGTIHIENNYVIYRSSKGQTVEIVDIDLPNLSFTARRLYLLGRKKLLPYRLKKLRVAFYFLSDLLKLKQLENRWFVDSDGKRFKYKKSKMVKVTFEPIDWWRFKDSSCLQVLIKLKKSNIIYECVSPPKAGESFAGLLHLDSKAKLLYGFFDQKYDSTIRKV